MTEPRWHNIALFSLLHDLSLSLLASLFAVLVIRWVSEPIPGYTRLVLIWLGFSTLGSVSGILLSGCSKDVKKYASVRSIARVIYALSIKEVVIVAVMLAGLVRMPSPAHGALAVLLDITLSAVALSYIRLAARLYSRDSNVAVKSACKSALVVGTDNAAISLANDLEKEGYDVVGFLSRRENISGRVIADHVVYYCKTDEDLERLQWRLGGVDGVFFPRKSARLDPDGGDLKDEIPQEDGMSMAGHIIKRAFDVGLSGFLLLIFAPLIGICAFMVRKEDGGPVIYRQERVGKGGAPFVIFKFRTMHVNAESTGTPALYSGENDVRLTRVGRFMRAHHLDELPQLWNVLRGDMSFIGYRPERPFYIDRIMEHNGRYRYLYQIRPGVTSYATLYNGYTDTMDKMLTRLDMDLYYLRNHSVLFDMKVLGLTFLSIISGKKF
jgi:lipopolysaccharide/colanic/teichoic acid biosynthesis glycosyltransferase